MTEITVRSARPNDAAAIAALGRQTFMETFVEGFGIPYPADDLETYLAGAFGAENLRRRIEAGGEGWWVGEADGRALAFANTGPNTLPHPDGRREHAELRRLYVAREGQGLGLGSALLKEALTWMEANTTGPLWIGVWSGNAKAIRLYEAHGFARAGEYQFPVGAWRDDEFILRRG